MDTATMTKYSPLLTAFAVAFTVGSAYAESSQHSSGPARQPYPVSMAGGSASDASPAAGDSAAPLGALLRDWNRAGFSPPSKPAQGRVYDRDGHVTSGGEYHAMVSLIRSAIKDSSGGRDQEALTKIAKVRTLLGH